jgi:hypothetical protein
MVMMEFKEFYWAHRDVFRLAMGVGVVLAAQTVLILWALRRLGELSHFRERLSRLADGLALLTDTTEAGLATIARELQQQQQGLRRPAPPRPPSRTGVGKRVLAAARKGEDLARIAEDEELSESEVRLHLKLAESRLREAGLSAR